MMSITWDPHLNLQEEANCTVFTWTIKNFDMCTHLPSKPLKSPSFSMFAWQMSKFHLMVYPRGVNQSSAGHVSLYVIKSNNNNERNDIEYSGELGIVTTREKQSLLRFRSLITQGNGRGLATLLDREKLLSTDRHLMLPDGNLILYCRMSVKESPDATKGQTRTGEMLQQLSEAFERAYENGQHSDAVLHTTEKTFKIHKAMIDARFPGLAEKLNSNSTKTENIEEQAANALLQYIYTGKLNKTQVSLFDLVASYNLPSHLKALLAVKTQNIQAVTSISRKVVSFRWIVRHFNSLKSNEVLKYSVFGDDSQRWTWLNIFLTVSTDGSTAGDAIFSVQRYSQECKRIICKITALDKSETFDHVFEKENCWKMPAFIKKSEILDENSDDDEVSFDFEVSLSDGSSTSHIKAIKFSPYSSSTSQIAEDLISFQRDLKMLLKNSRYSDVTLTSGEEKFPSHKFVLSARSPVFCEMFKCESSENKKDVIALEGHDSDVVKSMLSYIYSAEIDRYSVDIKHAIGLYCVANKYKISGLRKESVNLIKSTISADTIGEVLISADTWKDTELKEYVYNFV